MNFTIQISSEDSEQFSDLLIKIANELKEGKTCGDHTGESCCYNYYMEEESYKRKFIIYSIDQNPKMSNDPRILGMAFGESHHEAFEGFCQSEMGQNKLLLNPEGNIIIREVIGDPVYKGTVEIAND